MFTDSASYCILREVQTHPPECTSVLSLHKLLDVHITLTYYSIYHHGFHVMALRLYYASPTVLVLLKYIESLSTRSFIMHHESSFCLSLLEY